MQISQDKSNLRDTAHTNNRKLERNGDGPINTTHNGQVLDSMPPPSFMHDSAAFVSLSGNSHGMCTLLVVLVFRLNC